MLPRAFILLVLVPALSALAAPPRSPPAKPAPPAIERAKGFQGRPAPETSDACISCHEEETPGLVAQWRESRHAEKDVGCFDCHQAKEGEPDAFDHKGDTIAVVVTPRDCARCHEKEQAQFAKSHHAKAGDILASLDNLLAETVEGARVPFSPHSPTPGRGSAKVNGLAGAQAGCQQCHGAKVALLAVDGGTVTLDDLKPGADGLPTATDALARIARDDRGRPRLLSSGWPNTGIGRLNLDGTRGSCSACHARHDFSARRARSPENCGRCHLGPDHPQKEIYEESKHGVAFADARAKMNLDAKRWVAGADYSAAPTCATCHLSGNSTEEAVTHDPGERLAWNNRPPVSLAMDDWQEKRSRMKDACKSCHSGRFADGFFSQYDDVVTLYNEKFGKPGQAIMDALAKEGLVTPKPFDERIEWTWYELWHHEGRRARHGASMMAPDYVQWNGLYEVARRFSEELVPQARELTKKAQAAGKVAQAKRVDAVIDGVLSRPEHQGQRGP